MNAIWKLVGIGFLALVLLIPLALVDSTIIERKQRLFEARQTIAQRWSGDQTVGGPMLKFAVDRPVQGERGMRQVRVEQLLLPSSLTISGRMEVEMRYYGIYEVPVYIADLQIQGRFDASDLTAALGEETLAGPVQLLIPLADVRGVRGSGMIDWNGEPRELTTATLPGSPLAALATNVSLDRETDHSFHLDLRVAGTGSLQFLPLGERSRVELEAPWPDPGFMGSYLPDQREITDSGFDATWEVLALNRSFGQLWPAQENWAHGLSSAAFGVQLYQPISIYQRTERSTKYGVLFIALTFLGYFIFETLADVRLHPVQYGFLGLALACFYLLLLALSEHLGFGPAYGLAMAALCALSGVYSAAILGRALHGLMATALLAAVYGLLYVLVIGEDYSLLVGSLALFGMLAVAMLLTRNVDWYEVHVRPRKLPAPPST